MSAIEVSATKTLASSSANTPNPPPRGSHTTDVVYQDVRLYIEGVQIPFEAISVNQAIGSLPTAQIQVPPQSGLLDICRYYEPKVHIFYEDLNLGGYRLLFWGHIVNGSYSHSRSGSGSASITFSAVHKNHLLDQVVLDYSGYLNAEAPSAAGEGATVTVSAINSQQSIVQALCGITGVQEASRDEISSNNAEVVEADVTKIMKSHQELLPRFKGMPAIAMNLWNQLKKSVYSTGRFNPMMSGMMIPLVEEGVSYFKRMSGHPSLEGLIDDDRQRYCGSSGQDADVIVPPALKVYLTSAVQAKLAVEMASSSLQFSGEMTSFPSLLESFYYSVNYEIVTLASPSEVPVDPDSQSNKDLMAVETIIKPQLPFYYAPVCNVIFPRMFHSVQVSQEEGSLPTRVSAIHKSLPTPDGGFGSSYRGPHSIREAVSYVASLSGDEQASSVPNLSNTFGLHYNAPGRYEQGRGVKHTRIELPWWLQLMTRDENSKAGQANSGEVPEKGSPAYNYMLSLMASWQARHGYDVTENGAEIRIERNTDKDYLNPYSPLSGVYPYQSMLITSVDYEFSKRMAGGRSGTVDCIFNPYIVPGYPMDVLDDSPNHPSFHALCSSVTHTITSRSIGTTVGMLAVQTYAELSNYYTPPTPPWLQTALGLVSTVGEGGDGQADTTGITVLNAGHLLYNSEGKVKADDYYASTLGVAAADPTLLMDWATGQIIPQVRLGKGFTPGVKTVQTTNNRGDGNDFNTSVGNIRLVSRPIESRDSIEDKFSYKFVDLVPSNYNSLSIPDPNPKLEQDRFLEPGASPFLDYMETTDFINAIKKSVGYKSRQELAAENDKKSPESSSSGGSSGGSSGNAPA